MSAQESQLYEISKEEDAAALETRLLAGWDPNTPDQQGRTALEQAIAGDQFDVAACLLAYGANHHIKDATGRRVVSEEAMGAARLHQLRQRYHRFRRRDTTHIPFPSPEAKAWAEELGVRGIVHLPGWVPPDTLTRLQRDHRKFLTELQIRIAQGRGRYQTYDEELHWWISDRAYITNNAFKYSPALVRLCCDPAILSIAGRNLRREAHIQRGVGMHYLPAETSDHEMFAWHHDIEEQRVKMMILLTDIGEQDQYMGYVAGSHRLYHPYKMFFKNLCPLEYCREKMGELEIVKTVGRAGDVFLFDSNGSHRGHRAPGGAVRNTFFIEYSADNSQVWGGDIDPQALDGVDRMCAQAFDQMLAVEKKWNRPRGRDLPDWVISLPDVDSWLI